jgi:hypothetical protein
MSKTLTVKLDLRASSDFRLTVPARRQYVEVGTNADYPVQSEALVGYEGNVDLDVTGLPTGATSSIETDPMPASGSTIVTIGTAGVAPGIHYFNIIGSDYNPSGTVHAAASPALADVVVALALCSPGDTVTIPEGDVTWNSRYTITQWVKIIGAGSDKTIIRCNYAGGTALSESNSFISFNPTEPALDAGFRLSGITFDMDSKANGPYLYNSSSSVPIYNVRVDHCRFINHIALGRSFGVRGNVWGCVDNNYFDGMITNYGNNGNWLNSYTYPILNFEFGTRNNMYYEDNVHVHNNVFHDGGVGGRYCLRHNTYTYSATTANLQPFADYHGNAPNGNAGIMGVEIHDNVIDMGIRSGMMWGQRGGKAIVFNNAFTGSSTSSMYSRVREEYSDYDSRSPGYPHAGNGQPMHPSDSYYWRNTWNSVLKNPATDTWQKDYNVSSNEYDGLPAEPFRVVPQLNMDFWVENIAFDGSTGVGVGLLSARPSSGLSVGVGYWATDVEILYRATSATTWAAYYAPYDYPHPLRAIPDMGAYEYQGG